MCLTTTQKEPFIAENDIIVYKDCYVKKKFPFKITLHGWWREEYQYSKDESASFGIKDNSYGMKIQIKEGLHSHLKECYNSNTKWIIPKGSEYYISENNIDVVSNRLIFKSMIGPDYWFRKIVWKNK